MKGLDRAQKIVTVGFIVFALAGMFVYPNTSAKAKVANPTAVTNQK